MKYCIRFLHLTDDRQSLRRHGSETNKLQPVAPIISDTIMGVEVLFLDSFCRTMKHSIANVVPFVFIVFKNQILSRII